VTAEAIGRSFVHVASDDRGQAGMVGDPRGDAAAVCKIAGIAYIGYEPSSGTV
jgi:hypothetical protein